MFVIITGSLFMAASFGELDKNLNISSEYMDTYNTTSSITQLSLQNISWLGFIIFAVMVIAALMLFLKLKY